MNDDQPAERPHGLSMLVSPGAVRFARATDHYEETVAFYRNIVGLPVLADFVDSFGETARSSALPTARCSWRSCGHAGAATATRAPFEQLVIYLHGPVAASKATSRLDDLRESLPTRSRIPTGQPTGPSATAIPTAATWCSRRGCSAATLIPSTTTTPDGPRPCSSWWPGSTGPRAASFSVRRSGGLARPAGQLHRKWARPRRMAWRRHRRSPPACTHRPGAGGRAEEHGCRRPAPGHRNRADPGRGRGSAGGRGGGADGWWSPTAAADVGNLHFYQRCGFRLTGGRTGRVHPGDGLPGAGRHRRHPDERPGLARARPDRSRFCLT